MGSLAHLLQEVFSEFKIVFQDECKHRLQSIPSALELPSVQNLTCEIVHAYIARTATA